MNSPLKKVGDDKEKTDSSGIQEAHIDLDELDSIEKEIGSATRQRVLTLLQHQENAIQGEETNFQLIGLYQKAIGHRLFDKEGRHGIRGLGPSTFHAIAMYLLRKNIIGNEEYEYVLERIKKK